MVNSKSEVGFVAEEIASEFLEKRGYKVLGKNYRKPWGEIDIVTEKDGVISFVEVKANKKEMAAFEPELRVNYDKISRIIRTARTYLLSKRYPDSQEWGIDVVSVTFDKDRGVAKIKHFRNIEV